MEAERDMCMFILHVVVERDICMKFSVNLNPFIPTICLPNQPMLDITAKKTLFLYLKVDSVFFPNVKDCYLGYSR